MDWLKFMVAQEHQKDMVRGAEREALADAARAGARRSGQARGMRRLIGWLAMRRGAAPARRKPADANR